MSITERTTTEMTAIVLGEDRETTPAVGQVQTRQVNLANSNVPLQTAYRVLQQVQAQHAQFPSRHLSKAVRELQLLVVQLGGKVPAKRTN